MQSSSDPAGSSLLLQIALDMTSVEEAVEVTRKTVPCLDRIEIGTPLLLFGGLAVVRTFREHYPSLPIIADTKICDAGRRIADAAFEAGASVVTVVAAAADRVTWVGASEAARVWGGKVMVDLIGCTDVLSAAREAAQRNAHEICVHLPKRHPPVAESFEESLGTVRKVCESVSIPVFIAGGLRPEDVEAVSGLGARGLIVGSAITGSPDPAASARAFKPAFDTFLPSP